MQIKKWFTEFSYGFNGTGDADRSGRSKEVMTLEIADRIHGMIVDHWRIKVFEVTKVVDLQSTIRATV